MPKSISVPNVKKLATFFEEKTKKEGSTKTKSEIIKTKNNCHHLNERTRKEVTAEFNEKVGIINKRNTKMYTMDANNNDIEQSIYEFSRRASSDEIGTKNNHDFNEMDKKKFINQDNDISEYQNFKHTVDDDYDSEQNFYEVSRRASSDDYRMASTKGESETKNNRQLNERAKKAFTKGHNDEFNKETDKTSNGTSSYKYQNFKYTVDDDDDSERNFFEVSSDEDLPQLMKSVKSEENAMLKTNREIRHCENYLSTNEIHEDYCMASIKDDNRSKYELEERAEGSVTRNGHNVVKNLIRKYELKIAKFKNGSVGNETKISEEEINRKYRSLKINEEKTPNRQQFEDSVDGVNNSAEYEMSVKDTSTINKIQSIRQKVENVSDDIDKYVITTTVYTDYLRTLQRMRRSLSYIEKNDDENDGSIKEVITLTEDTMGKLNNERAQDEELL